MHGETLKFSGLYLQRPIQCLMQIKLASREVILHLYACLIFKTAIFSNLI